MTTFPHYDPSRSYDWNYEQAPAPVDVAQPLVPGEWRLCGLPLSSPLGMPAGPLLNGAWCLYYASLGFDVLTYKTVRSRARACYPLPNLQPVSCSSLDGGGQSLTAARTMQGSWAVSFGMPSRPPAVWRADVERARRALDSGKRLVVSVVGTVEPGWGIQELAADYAQCARWAVDSGADAVEANFSCPNVATSDGQLYQHPAHARLVAESIRSAIGAVPLILKIGWVPTRHSASDLVNAVSPSANALSMVNCISAFVVEEGQGALFAGESRGIGGAAIRAASLRQVALFRDVMDDGIRPLEIIAVGGVFTVEHVAQFLGSGASHVQLATAAMLDPGVGLKLRGELAARLCQPTGGP